MCPKAVVRLLRLSTITFAISQAFSMNSWAATDAERIAELEKKLEKSLAQIERLSTRISELEKGSAPASAPASATINPQNAAQQDRIDTLERNLAQIVESQGRNNSINTGVPLHGFTDVGYAYTSKPGPGVPKGGFALGNVDFYLTPEFGDRIKSLVELCFELESTGELLTDLERLQIGYTLNDALTLWVGRFHTPNGYWNTGFHHGAQIQTSILRPRMISFEDQGGFLPAHTVGVWANGLVSLNAGKIGYDAYIANGHRIVDGVLDFNAVQDDNSNKLLGGNFRYRFKGSLNGLTLGMHGFSEKVGSYTGGMQTDYTKVNMLGAYGFYEGEDWEIISEYYQFRNRDLSGGTGKHSSWSGFTQVGKTFNGKTTPYLRIEKANLNQMDRFFTSQVVGQSYERQALGVRYDLTTKTAIKVEVNRTDETRDGGDKYNEAQAQFSARF